MDSYRQYTTLNWQSIVLLYLIIVTIYYFILHYSDNKHSTSHNKKSTIDIANIFNNQRGQNCSLPQINYFFERPDYYYEFDDGDLSLGIKDLETGRNLTFFEVLTSSRINDLLFGKLIGSFKIIAVTKDGPSIYLLTEDRQVVQLKLKLKPKQKIDPNIERLGY